MPPPGRDDRPTHAAACRPGCQRGAVAIEPGKTRVTIRLDNDVLDWYRKQAQEHGGNYQTAINAALREQMTAQDGALERVLRRVIRKEMLA
ncbi:CopG family transcriptional regulator [Acidithiobacillus sp. RW2]|uniref:CopG family transcriptional regulator n=1 Tax=Acidithiobacillus sulfurivorans TaxID=1958756 RepID=A0ABS5ZTY5_9PROT|nr:CopG family transcriptional regulator [Acidithiobacillus sulfurivorans]